LCGYSFQNQIKKPEIKMAPKWAGNQKERPEAAIEGGKIPEPIQ